MTKKVSLWSYGYDLPSFRHRIRSLIPSFEAEGWDVETVTVPSKRYYRRILERMDIIRNSDVIVMSKLKLNPLEMLIIRKNAKTIIYDFDDAIYLRRPKKLGQTPGKSFWRYWKFQSMCKHSDMVFAGNEFIAQHAAKVNQNIKIVPTPVNADDYGDTENVDRNGMCIVWIGLPGNLVYLEMVHDALRELQQEFPDMTLRVVSSKFPDWDDVNIEQVEWSTESETQSLKTAGIGIMPLTDDEWSRGKCAFKLLQYMAAGLPCVASPVGANKNVVVEGETGFHAETSEQWKASLHQLLSSKELRDRYGENGRHLIDKQYDRKVVAKNAMTHLSELTK